MSVISMIEVLVLLYLILDGIFHDVIDNIATFKRKIVSFLNGTSTFGPSMLAGNKKPPNKDTIDDNDLEEDEHEIGKIYVSINSKCFGYRKYDFFKEKCSNVRQLPNNFMYLSFRK